GGRIADRRQLRPAHRLDGGGAGAQRQGRKGQGGEDQGTHGVFPQRAANWVGWARAATAAGPATARPGPTATASMVRPDWTLRIGVASPRAALRVARPVTVRLTPSTANSTWTMSLRAMTWGAARSRAAT